MRVAEAYNGADVKRLMRIQRPDAVLMDATIGPAASADVWRALDQSESGAHVVVFGNFRHESVRTLARDHRAVCLAPQSEEDLVAAIQQLIGRYQTARKKTARLHSELSANVRDFQIQAMRTLVEPRPRDLVILVAEDEECVRRFFSATLERGGYMVLEAANGDEAVRALWNYAGVVRLVILDWAMPGLTGVEVVRTLRRVSPETRLLICTGSPEEIVRSSLRGETVEGILEKPFLAVELLDEAEKQVNESLLAASPNGGAGKACS